MANGKALHALVHTMSKGEKRHFKLHCGIHRGESNYQRLFDAIARSDRYNEADLKAEFAGETFVRQFHVTKHYLRSLILKSLRSYHSEASQSAKAKEHLRNGEILYHKELFAAAQEELEKARKIAEKHELLGVLTEILDQQRTLIQVSEPHQFEKLGAANAVQAKVIAKLQNKNQYVDLIIDVSRAAYNDGTREFDRREWLDDPANAQSMEATVLHYNASYFLHLQEGSVKDAEATMQDLLDLLESDQERIRETPGLYAASINNFLSFYLYQKNYDRVLHLVTRAKQIYGEWHLRGENRSLLKQILRTYTIELEVVRNHTLLSAGEDYIDQIAAHVDATSSKMPQSYLMLFWFQLAYIYFMRGSLRKAVQWVNPLIQTRNKKLRIDIQVHARMLNLMIQLDQDSIFVMRYFVDSAKRYLKKYKSIEPYETVLLHFFSTIGRSGILDRKARLIELSTTLFPEDADSMVPKDAMDFIDYRQWLSART